MPFIITKASGEQQPFDRKKLERSLQKTGANASLIQDIITEVERLRPKTTHDIYEYALGKLKEADRPLATRYNLKRALIDLGPAGFPFEKFIAHIFRGLGYQAETDKEILGQCVAHEVDVLLNKNSQYEIVECKFHNRAGLICDVKIPLYVKARFEDLKNPNQQHAITRAWVVTNTRFSSQAIQYGECVNLQLLDWSYPAKDNLPQLIDRLGLHPTTALTSLTQRQKQVLIDAGFILCNEASQFRPLLQQMKLSDVEIQQLMYEAEEVGKIPKY